MPLNISSSRLSSREILVVRGMRRKVTPVNAHDTVNICSSVLWLEHTVTVSGQRHVDGQSTVGRVQNVDVAWTSHVRCQVRRYVRCAVSNSYVSVSHFVKIHVLKITVFFD